MAMDVRALVAASVAQERRLEVLANNLANVNTVGFKERPPLFSLIPFPKEPGGVQPSIQSVSLGPSSAPEGAERLRFGMGLQMTGVKTNYKEGNLFETGNPLDLAERPASHRRDQGIVQHDVFRCGKAWRVFHIRG